MLNSRTYIATPPGATIKEQLEERNMSQKEFATRMGMSEKHVSKLINGEVILTPETAYKLEMVLEVPAKFWNGLEALYRELEVKVKMENAMDTDIELSRKFPYSEMASYGWVPKTGIQKERVVNLRKFFGVVELSFIENTVITRIAQRRLAITEKSDLALIAWVQEAKIKARGVETAEFNVRNLKSIIPDIRKMTLMNATEFCPVLKKSLASCGVVLVFIPHLKGSFLHGATFVDGNRFVVGLTTRGKDADRFWFSLLHELAHIILGHTKKTEGTSEDDEREADRWAEEALIDSMSFADFLKKSDFTKESVIRYADKIKIAPGIVVGRMQQEGIIRHNMLNELKTQYTILSDT